MFEAAWQPGVEMDVWALLVGQYLRSSPGAGSQNSHSLEDSEQGVPSFSPWEVQRHMVVSRG